VDLASKTGVIEIYTLHKAWGLQASIDLLTTKTSTL